VGLTRAFHFFTVWTREEREKLLHSDYVEERSIEIEVIIISLLVDNLE
jgi:hypothetical protein